MKKKTTGAEILLQPMGICGKQTKERLEIRYNVMKMMFEPNVGRHTYAQEEIRFINRHIHRFCLNDPKFRTKQLADFIKNTIDNGGVLPKYEYNNMVVELFAKLLEGKTAEEKTTVCSRIYTMIFLRL